MGEELTEEEAQDAGRYALTLSELNRNTEAERYARAALILFGEKDWQVLHWMRFLIGILMMKQGRPEEALPVMLANIKHVTAGARMRAGQAYIGQAMLMTGAFSVQDAIKYGDGILGKFRSILLFSIWLENVDDLKAVLEFAESPAIQKVVVCLQLPKMLLKVLTGGKISVSEIDALAPEPETMMQHLICKTQILRLQGKTAPARKAHAQAVKLQEVDSLALLTMASHFENARQLDLITPAVDEWFKQHTWCDEVRGATSED